MRPHRVHHARGPPGVPDRRVLVPPLLRGEKALQTDRVELVEAGWGDAETLERRKFRVSYRIAKGSELPAGGEDGDDPGATGLSLSSGRCPPARRASMTRLTSFIGSLVRTL